MVAVAKDEACRDDAILQKLIERIIFQIQRTFRESRDIDDRESLPIIEIHRRLEATLSRWHRRKVCLSSERVRLLLDAIGTLEGFPIRLWIVQADVRSPAMVRDARFLIKKDPAITSRELQNQLESEHGRVVSHRVAREVLSDIRGPITAQPRAKRRSRRGHQ